MKLSQLCKETEYELIQGSLETEVVDLVYDSRKIEKQTTFFCMVGAVTDGHQYITDAIEKGASVIVVERSEGIPEIPDDITVLRVASTRKALAQMSAAFFGYPAREMTMIGLTGTKGKTTTTYMIKGVLEEAGKKVGLIGTIGALIGEEKIASKNTTPESYELHKMFREMADAGCEYVVMEVSSQGLKMDRTAGIQFHYGVFTNLSPDHISPTEHASMEEYMACKSLLFRQCDVGIVNADDENAEAVLAGHTCKIKTFAVEKKADLMAANIGFIREYGKLGMSFHTSGMLDVDVKVHIPGRFNVYNAMVCMMVCTMAGIPEKAIVDGLSKVQVKGRVELVPVSGKFHIIIDYAHNELSTRSVLNTLQEYHPNHMMCVFGGGGNRSKVRRYDMGRVCGEMADLCVITCDNPRDEDLHKINDDIKVGLDQSHANYIEIDDRKEAIAYCIEHAVDGDMIVLLGKGHENYQEIKGVKYHFDEREAIAEIMAEINA